MGSWKPFFFKWLRISIIFVVFTAALALPTRTGGDCPPFYGYSFIDPGIVRLRSDFAPFLLKFRDLAGFYKQADEVLLEENIREWWERFCRIPKPIDIATVVYDFTIPQLEDLLSSIVSERVSVRELSPVFSANSFAFYLFRYRCTEAIEYLIFAKRCEPYAIARPNLWEERRRDEKAMQDLIDYGRRRFLGFESHYFRLRMAYQLIRLAHYLRDYDQTLELYDYLMPKIDNDPSIVSDWIEAHRAGALQAKGERVKAAYLFSRVFEKCPGKREAAFRSFDIRTDEEWQQCLLLCRDDHERAVLHLLRANSENARLVEEMWNVYQYEPQNENLELLALREIQRLERDLLGQDFNNRRADNLTYHRIPRPIAGKRVVDLQTFVRTLLREKKVKRPDFWMLLEGYLEVLAGNYYFAARTFDEARDFIKNDTLDQQLETWTLVLRILAFNEINDQVEKEAAAIQRNKYYAQFRDFPTFLRDRFTALYQQGDDPGKAFLSQYSLYDLKLNPDMNVVEDLLALAGKEKLNRFEKELVAKPDGTPITNDLINLKASLFLSEGQMEAALESFKQMDRTEWDNYGLFNPFVDRMRDCVSCRLPDTVVLYNKGELMEEMLDLEYRAKAETDPDRAAELYYRLGVANYNITYFGNSWRVLDAFRSSSSLARHPRGSESGVVPYPGAPFGNREFFNTAQARFFFAKARILAKDPNIAARALFGEAKCEQKDFYVYAEPGVQQPRQSFDLLLNVYGDTPFVLNLINECKYFGAYARK